LTTEHDDWCAPRAYGSQMSDYDPPLDDIRFVLDEVVDLASLAKLERFAHAEPDLVHGVVDEAGRFVADLIAPLNTVGDRNHSRRNEDGSVTTPRLRRRLPRRRGRRLGIGPVSGRARRRGFPGARGDRDRRARGVREPGVLAVPRPHPGRDPPAARPRKRGAAGHVPAQAGDRRVDRHHEPDRARRRLGCGRGPYQGDAGGRRHMASHRPEDLHHLRRARHGRQHHPSRPSARPRSAARHPRHLVLRRAQDTCRPGRRPRRAQPGQLGVDRAETRHPRQPDLRARLRPRPRLPHRQAQRGHALHDHDDEQRPPPRGLPGPRRGEPGLPAIRRLRQRAPPRPGTGGRGGGRRRRSSTIPTSGACC
jgi:hypothetical protein